MSECVSAQKCASGLPMWLIRFRGPGMLKEGKAARQVAAPKNRVGRRLVPAEKRTCLISMWNVR
jgi:hypothetical protein